MQHDKNKLAISAAKLYYQSGFSQAEIEARFGLTVAIAADETLQGAHLAIDRGERVAFVGESGGGKTTLVNLIMKLYPVTAGVVHIMNPPMG